MQHLKTPTGTDVLDQLLDGGFDNDVISILYGPGGAGKTNFCLHAAFSVVASGKKAIYIDTEGGFSINRAKQLDDFSEERINQIFFLQPTSFNEQQKAFEKLRDLAGSEIGIIIVDTIAMLYRLEIGKSEKLYQLNRELGRQISLLSEIARKSHIPIVVTNQVYSGLDKTDRPVMVGGDLLAYQSKCLIELQRDQEENRYALLRKHRSLPEGRQACFSISGPGIVKY